MSSRFLHRARSVATFSTDQNPLCTTRRDNNLVCGIYVHVAIFLVAADLLLFSFWADTHHIFLIYTFLSPLIHSRHSVIAQHLSQTAKTVP